MDIDKQRSRRNWSILLGPLFLFSEVYFYDQTGLGRHFHSNSYRRTSWQFEHRTRIGNLPLSLSDFYFVVAIFCGVCGVIYFVLSNVARRPLEILLGYAHFFVSIVTIALVVSYIGGSALADPLEPIPSVYGPRSCWRKFCFFSTLAGPCSAPRPWNRPRPLRGDLVHFRSFVASLRRVWRAPG